MNEIIDQIVYYLEALWRRRWLALGTAFVVAAVAWSVVVMMPNTYKASARIYVDTANVLQPLLRGLAVDNNVQSQVSVMRQTLISRPNLEEVARRTDLDLEATGPAEMEALTDRLARDITIRADRQNLFDISYTSTDPVRARNIVQALTAIFVENNLGENREDMDNAQAFLKSQIRQYEAKLDKAEARLSDFKQKNMAFLPGQTGFRNKLEQAQEDLASLKSQLEDAQTRREVVRQALRETPAMIGGGQMGAGPPSATEAQIMEIQARLSDLQARYTEKHPDVVTLKRRLEKLIDQREREATKGPGQQSAAAGSVPNPVYSDLKMEMVREQSKIETLRSQIARAESRVRELQAKLQRVPEVEAKLQRLTRDREVLQENYEKLLARQESARISSDREVQGNRFAFRIIEAAEVPNLPAGPNRPLFMAAGLVLALGCGAGVAWLLALTNVTYSNADTLGRDFDLPVIGAIHDLVEDQDTGRRRGQVLRVVVACLGLTGIFGVLLVLESRLGLQSVSPIAFGLNGGVLLAGIGLVLVGVGRLKGAGPAARAAAPPPAPAVKRAA